MAKKGTFFLKKWSTKTSFEALIIIGVEGCSVALFNKRTIGKLLLLGALKVKLFIVLLFLNVIRESVLAKCFIYFFNGLSKLFTSQLLR